MTSLLKQFVSKQQQKALAAIARGEEAGFVKEKVAEMTKVIETMPKTYDQDGLGDKAVVYLHYFKGNCDWHILEKDMGAEQRQAFGLANLGYGGELGYISIAELVENDVELDLYWTPKMLKDIKGERL